MSIYQDKAKECKCCGKHVPLPTTLKHFNGLIVCPTTFENIVEYKRIWDSAGVRPNGSIRKHFSEYVQKIVESTYSEGNNDSRL